MVGSTEKFIVYPPVLWFILLTTLATVVLFKCGSKKSKKSQTTSPKTNRESQKNSRNEVVAKKGPVKQTSPHAQPAAPAVPAHIETVPQPAVEATQLDGTVKQKDEATDLGSTNKKGHGDEDRTADGVPSLPKVNYSQKSEEYNESKKSKTKTISSKQKPVEKKKKSTERPKTPHKTDKTFDSEKRKSREKPRTATTQEKE